ncbi:uncharacterized protein JCM6883_006337 [Sporobolomyces salmoneus]|uniref:uncharacterized protein n=1 Tax=Sporobolomyces salmoneus TaxID=183962 RepID=UPI003178D6A9
MTRTPPTPLRRRVFYGTAIHSKSLTEIVYLQRALIGVDEQGVIAFIERDIEEEKVEEIIVKHEWSLEEGTTEKVVLGKGEFLIPGLIDTHTHAPQHINAAFGQQYELLDWLKYVTFPAEAKFKDPAYARKTYEGVVQRVINSGTTTCCWYGTLHMTTRILAAICHCKGQRALVGKCNMDRNSAPDYQEDSAAKSLADTEDYVSFVREHCSNPLPEATNKNLSSLVQPILTPRFAISCTDEVLEGLGKMMDRDPDLPLQTHLAENPAEIEFTKSLYPSLPSYTAVYDHFNLLRRNTILAHCVHLEQSELTLIKGRESGISHCPNSNFNLRSGTARVADMLDRGIKVGLGTDVSGGTAIGILSAIRSASTASKAIIFTDRASSTSTAPSPQSTSSSIKSPDGQTRPSNFFSQSHLTLETLFYLATLGGAQLCGMEDRIGSFEVGKEFDALLIQTGQRKVETPVEQAEGEGLELLALEEEVENDFPKTEDGFNPSLLMEPDEPVERVFEKFLFAGDDRNIGTVFVRGRVIGGARPLSA